MKVQVLDASGNELEAFDELTLVDVGVKYFNRQLGGRCSIEIRDEDDQSVFYVATSVKD